MGFLSYLLNIGEWNADPTQQMISRMLIGVVEGREHPISIIELIQSQGWPKDKQIERLTHALSVVRVSRGDLYRAAQEVYRQIGFVLKETYRESLTNPINCDVESSKFQTE
jgi:hypothetical protein